MHDSSKCQVCKQAHEMHEFLLYLKGHEFNSITINRFIELMDMMEREKV